MEEWLMGRRLLKKEIPKEYHHQLKQSVVIRQKGMKKEGSFYCCQRCGTKWLAKECCIKNKYEHFYYCQECLILGRVESRRHLYSVKEKINLPRRIDFQWQGKLTPDQKKISEELVLSFKRKKNHMVHAVTGAGKTEMLFPLLKKALSQGARVAVVSPRVDVCLELYPRFQEVFPQEELALLYGASEETYRYTSFVVATTHQLLRFYQGFDLIVVDEVDAFPYAGNQGLEYGVHQALKPQGVLVYLTATPSQTFKEKIDKKELLGSYLPKRYHGYPLPEPESYFDFFLVKNLEKHQLSKYFLKLLRSQERQCLIFFPNIERMKICYVELKKLFPNKKIAYVYANKSDRKEQIIGMRKKQVDWLLTTTILERGVTFPGIDVIVFEADHRVFNTASLVQIAGRVGRKKEFPTGHIYFLHTGRTRAIKQAISQIKWMNQKAGFK